MTVNFLINYAEQGKILIKWITDVGVSTRQPNSSLACRGEGTYQIFQPSANQYTPLPNKYPTIQTFSLGFPRPFNYIVFKLHLLFVLIPHYEAKI